MSKLSTRQETLLLAEKLGVKVIEGCMEICLEAPHHKVFRSCGVHGTVHDYSGEFLGKTAAWQAARDELRIGLDDCPAAEGMCEVCDE